MGAYTEHWDRYKKRNIKGTLYALLLFAVGLPAVALVGMWLEPFDTSDTAVFVGLLVLWLSALTILLVRFSKVVCPRCQTNYSRGKFLANCPQCGLRMLQEDP